MRPKKHIFSRLLIAGILAVTLFGAASLTQAQSPLAVSPSPAVSDQKLKIRQLKELFRDQLEQYQLSDREYQLYKQQYKQLQTLASLEKAVVKAKEAMIKRNAVLLTYFDLLFAQLQVAPGVLPQKKTELEQSITTIVDKLRQNQANLDNISKKEDIAVQADYFDALKPEIYMNAFAARAYIQIGAYQDLQDRSKSLTAEVKADHASQSASAYKQSTRERAYGETDRQTAAVDQLLTGTYAKMAKAESINENWYKNLQEQLIALQSGLEKLYGFILELTTY